VRSFATVRESGFSTSSLAVLPIVNVEEGMGVTRHMEPVEAMITAISSAPPANVVPSPQTTDYCAPPSLSAPLAPFSVQPAEVVGRKTTRIRAPLSRSLCLWTSDRRGHVFPWPALG
jgi:hypothetical protein